MHRLPSFATAALGLAALLSPLGVPSNAGTAIDFPFEQGFTNDAAGGSLLDDAAVESGWLRLTSNDIHRRGSWITDQSFDTSLGLDISFDFGMYDRANGGDGISFFLADGAEPVATGAHGAGLGYACKSESEGAGPCAIPGVPGGYLGIGFDRYGNFSLPLNGSGPGRAPDSVVVRGSGDGLVGYPYRLGTPAPGGSLMTGERAGARKARIRIQPAGTAVRFSILLNRGGDTPLETVFDSVDVNTWSNQAGLPPTLRLGFAGSTGSATNVHEIDDLRVNIPADLALAKAGPREVVAGASIDWTIVASNVGENPVGNAVVHDTIPASVSDVSWACSATSGSRCIESEGSGPTLTAHTDLAPGGRATYRVTGTVDPAATGHLDNTASVEVPSDRVDVDAGNDSATSSTAVASRAALSTGKSFDFVDETDEVIAPGERFTYTVSTTNAGPSAARDVGATDALPAPIRFVSSDDGCTAVAQDVTCRSSTLLGSGESRPFTFTVELDPEYAGDGSDLGNIAVATSPSDTDGADPSDRVFIPVSADEDTDPEPELEPVEENEPKPEDEMPAETPDDSAADVDSGTPGRLAFTGATGLVLSAVGALALAAAGSGFVLKSRRRRRS